MASTERVLHRALIRAQRIIRTLGEELRETRIAAGLSQSRVAAVAGISRSRYSRIESGAVLTVRVMELARLAAVLGLDLVARLYPGAGPLRDGAHSRRLDGFLQHAARPLVVRREVGLPAREGALEQRAWDAIIAGNGRRTAIELEMRLRDVQALERRMALKRRDDPTDGFLLLLAATKTNRQVLRENPGVFADLPRLRPSVVIGHLRAGRHPPSGLLFL